MRYIRLVILWKKLERQIYFWENIMGSPTCKTKMQMEE
jgi:hypothetical protein